MEICRKSHGKVLVKMHMNPALTFYVILPRVDLTFHSADFTILLHHMFEQLVMGTELKLLTLALFCSSTAECAVQIRVSPQSS